MWCYSNNYYTDCHTLFRYGTAILSQPENCGKYHNTWASLNITSYALDQKLIMQLRPCVSYHKFSGTYNISKTVAFISADINYYFGSFHAGARYSSPERGFNQNDPVYYKKRSQYWFTAGWGNAQWTANIFIINPFRGHWRGTDYSLQTPHYTYNSTTIGVNDARRINISVTYTFSYGKKVSHGNDLNGTDTGKSSIR